MIPVIAHEVGGVRDVLGDYKSYVDTLPITLGAAATASIGHAGSSLPIPISGRGCSGRQRPG